MGTWRSTARRVGCAGALAAVAAGALVGAQAATSASAPRLPLGLARADGARQLIVVTSASSHSSVATLRAYGEVDGAWRLAFGPMTARVGVNGWLAAARRREGDGTTPEGIFSLGKTIYGVDPNPGVAYRYHRLVPGDYWDENPVPLVRYNTFQHSADTDCADNPYGGDTECLWLERSPYAYFAVVDFNTPATGAYGSAIFLHVGTAGPTAGCISIAQRSLVRILDWLRPADDPRIVLAGPTPLARY